MVAWSEWNVGEASEKQNQKEAGRKQLSKKEAA